MHNVFRLVVLWMSYNILCNVSEHKEDRVEWIGRELECVLQVSMVYYKVASSYNVHDIIRHKYY